MQKTNKTILLFFFVIGLALQGYAADRVKIGDITYYICNYSWGSYAEVTSPEEGNYSGTVTIPEEVTYEGVTYPVTSISGYAFCYDPITSITIPNSVKEIRINAFLSCRQLTEIRIPASVENIGVAVFEGCTNLKNVIFEDGDKELVFETQSNGYSSESFTNTNVDSLYMGRVISREDSKNPFAGMSGTLRALKFGNAYDFVPSFFSNFTSLKNVYISDKTTRIYSNSFSGCTALSSVDLPKGLKSIESSAFQNCVALASVFIPDGVTKIGGKAFYGCSSLESVRLPESTTDIETDAFSGCSSLMELVVLAPYARFGGYVGANGSLFAYQNVLDDKAYVRNKCKKVAINNPYYAVVCTEQNLSSLTFRVKEIRHEQTDCSLTRVEFGSKVMSPTEEGNYIQTDLLPGTTYNVTVVVSVNGSELKYKCPVSTSVPSIDGSPQNLKQTGLRIELTTWQYDEAMLPTAMGVEFGGSTYETKSLGKYSENSGFYGTINITGLVPVKTYSFIPYIKYKDGKKYYGSSRQFTTKGISPTIINGMAGATTFRCDGEYTEGTATFKNGKFTFNGKEYDGNSLLLTGLDPNTSYTVTYTATTEEGSEETCSAYIFKTINLSLVTEKPRCVSSTCAIVAATTNISENEPNVGFQWKKYDAPVSLAPNEGYAAIYDGKLEGYVKNLQSTFYYNVRAFYKSAEGKYYYGDWVTFDPSDFSYFEPTVHTYEATEIGSSSAKVKGYVLAGTDDIIEQGFEYWTTGSTECKAMRVRATAENNVSTVFSTGQVMTATLTDLLPSSTYCFRSFVKTASGTTYGEEQTFTTDASTTGIGNVETDASSPVAVGYYDLSGRKHSEPQKGMNIVRYSDGSARKVLIK